MFELILEVVVERKVSELATSKIVNPYLVIFLVETPIFEWYVVMSQPLLGPLTILPIFISSKCYER